VPKAVASPATHEPALARYRPDRFFGSVSESLFRNLKKYIQEDKERLLTVPGTLCALFSRERECVFVCVCV
jgi:hypothetical protein